MKLTPSAAAALSAAYAIPHSVREVMSHHGAPAACQAPVSGRGDDWSVDHVIRDGRTVDFVVVR